MFDFTLLKKRFQQFQTVLYDVFLHGCNCFSTLLFLEIGSSLSAQCVLRTLCKSSLTLAMVMKLQQCTDAKLFVKVTRWYWKEILLIELSQIQNHFWQHVFYKRQTIFTERLRLANKNTTFSIFSTSFIKTTLCILEFLPPGQQEKKFTEQSVAPKLASTCTLRYPVQSEQSLLMLCFNKERLNRHFALCVNS